MNDTRFQIDLQTPSIKGQRHWQGCYIDVDEPRSRYRILSRRLHTDQVTTEAQ